MRQTLKRSAGVADALQVQTARAAVRVIACAPVFLVAYLAALGELVAWRLTRKPRIDSGTPVD